ncbi:MAG: hypothetical protein ABI164_08290 [Acidobacteriaceae bacterium]
MLTIEANNSDLSQILRSIASLSGMTIDGLDKSSDEPNKNTRVFGVYGPGNPSEVLTRLLTGSGYNFVMVGNAPDGAPHELLLTARNSNPAATPPPSAPPAAASAPPPSESEPSPDTLNNSGPEGYSPAPPTDTETDEEREQRIQQNMQRLQHMREQQDRQGSPQ